MASFRFTLQTLLELRLRQEREVQRELALAERYRLAVERRLHQQQRDMVASRHILRSALVGRLEPGALRLKAVSSLQAMRLVQQIARDLAAAHARTDAVRDRLVEATRRRRAIELLRERRHAAWRFAQERREAAALDDLAMSASARPGDDHPCSAERST